MRRLIPVTLGYTGAFDNGDTYNVVIGGNTVSFVITNSHISEGITLAGVRCAFIEKINKSAAAIDITASAGTNDGDLLMTSNFPEFAFTLDASSL